MNFIESEEERKGDFYGDDYEPIQSEYLDEKTRARIYRSWLESELRDGERRNYISEALRKTKTGGGKEAEKQK